MHSAGVCDVIRRHGREEDIVEEGGFEGEVTKGVEEMPDEESPPLERRPWVEKGEGGAEGGCGESCNGGEGEDARMVEYRTFYEFRQAAHRHWTAHGLCGSFLLTVHDRHLFRGVKDAQRMGND